MILGNVFASFKFLLVFFFLGTLPSFVGIILSANEYKLTINPIDLLFVTCISGIANIAGVLAVNEGREKDTIGYQAVIAAGVFILGLNLYRVSVQPSILIWMFGIPILNLLTSVIAKAIRR